MATAQANRKTKDIYHGGEVFKQKRKERFWTQAIASRKIEAHTGQRIPAQELSRLEKGQTQNPSMETLVAVGDAYGMTPNDVAEEFGYWKAPKGNVGLDAGWIKLRGQFHQLNKVARARVLQTLETLIQGEASKEAMNDEGLGDQPPA